MKKLLVLVLCMTVLICGCAPKNTGTTTFVTNVATGTTISTTATSGTTEPKPTTAPARWILQNEVGVTDPIKVVPWSEYTTAKIHKAEVNQTWSSISPFSVQLIDKDMKLYVANEKNKSRFPGSVGTLGIYSLSDGTYKPFAEASSSEDQISYLAQNEKYIVWNEGYIDAGVFSEPILHVYVRETGEDISFVTPDTDSAYYKNRRVGPLSPVLLLDDVIYLDAVIKTSTSPEPFVQYLNLYRFNIATRKLELVEADAARPFLYNGKPAWFSLDYKLVLATAKTASDIVTGIPSLPLNYIAGTASQNTVITNNISWMTKRPNIAWEFTLMKDGIRALIITNSRDDVSVSMPETNGDYLTYNARSISQSTPETTSMFFDVKQSVLADITNDIGNAKPLGFFANKLVFTDMADTTADSPVHAVIYWIDLDELK